MNGGIVINPGKTLTVTKANSSSNVIPTITGGGNLVVSDNNTFTWKGMSGTSSLVSITQENASGGIAITGHGTINVSGDVNIAATLTFTPSSAEPAYITDGFTIKNGACDSTHYDSAADGEGGITKSGGGEYYGEITLRLPSSGVRFYKAAINIDAATP